MSELTCPLVLGIPWLRKYNPQIDWRVGSVDFTDPTGLLHMC